MCLSQDAKNEWNQKFVDVDQGTLFHLILAANYLNIKTLLDLTCKTVADMIKGKTPEEIRAHFNIQNDFTYATSSSHSFCLCLTLSLLLRHCPRRIRYCRRAAAAPPPPRRRRRFCCCSLPLTLTPCAHRRPEEEEEVRRENAWCEDI